MSKPVPKPLTAKSKAGEKLWKSFLEETKDQQDDALAYQCPWMKNEFAEITEYSDMLKFEKHCAHVLLWCPAKETDMMLDKYPLKYRIPMQLRFDGKLGFPGGLVDEMLSFDTTDTTFDDFIKVIKQGLLREVEEEMMIKVDVDPKYVYSTCSTQQRKECDNYFGKCIAGYIMHFFTCQVPINYLEAMERKTLEIMSNDEVLGLTRVPIYFMYDNVRGLPSFITNCFVGCALEQLMRACIFEGFLTPQEVRFAYYVASKLLPAVK